MAFIKSGWALAPGSVSAVSPVSVIARRFYCFALLALALLLNACTTVSSQRGPLKVAKTGHAIHDALVDHYERWQGTPYRLGGTGHAGIDCSAYMQRVYADAFGIKLPRTTLEQMRLGDPVARNRLSAGDLVFFSPSGKGRHVGIYLADDRFLHAGSSSGVTISALDHSYWSSSYVTSRRLLVRP